MGVNEDINGFAWRIGWSPWLTVLGVMVVMTAIAALILEEGSQIGGAAFIGLLAGFAIYFWGTREVNANYEELLQRFVSKTERQAARGIDVAEASTYSLTWGNGESPIFVDPSRTYFTTTLVVTGTSVNINEGAKYEMDARNSKGGGTNRELFYDQITAVDSHQDGNYSTMEIRTAGGESIEVGSGVTETVDAAISEVRKQLRNVKAGRDTSMGQTAVQQTETSPDTQTGSTAQNGDVATSNASAGDSQTKPDPEPKEPCLACGDQIDADAAFCPSCGTESPFDPGAETPSAESEEETVEPETATPAIVDVADAIERRTEPNSSAARQLCRALGDESADEADVRSALEEAIERLETASEVSEALAPLERRSSTTVYENIKQDLESQRGRLPAAVEPLVGRLVELNRDIDRRESEHDEIIGDVETICSQAARSDAVSFRNGDTEDRVSELATALESGDVVVTEPSVAVGSVAEEVDRRLRPSSELGRKLIDRLRAPNDESELEATIRESVETLEEYAETREMLSEINTRDVKRRLESLDRELESQDTPVYSHLADRVRELEALIDDSETVDDIQLYAIYQEISFYDRTLLPRLSRSMSGTASEDGDEMLESVQRRIEEIDSEFVSVRPDHNHSIPKHFLGLAEELSADAEQALRSHPERAAGVLLAADAVLDHVEELYERNEYSVMLRRLRG